MEKTREKIAESERVIELGDIHKSIIEPTPGEEILLTEEEKKLKRKLKKCRILNAEKLVLVFIILIFHSGRKKPKYG